MFFQLLLLEQKTYITLNVNDSTICPIFVKSLQTCSSEKKKRKRKKEIE